MFMMYLNLKGFPIWISLG